MRGQVDGVSSAAEFWSNFVQSRVAHTQRISYRDRPDIVAQARQTIDDEVAAMHLAMCSLRTHRNTLAPISGLPSEILARILEFHAMDQPPSKQDLDGDLSGGLGWIRVTHVCRFWRDAALHHPSLWRNVTNQLGLSWLGLMLDRAKSVPLSYSHLGCGQGSERSLTRVLPGVLFRIRSLSVSDKPDNINLAAQLLKSPARMLYTLELIAQGNTHSILPEDVLENDAPMLRRLHLNGINVSWSSPILCGLKYLRLEHDKYHNARDDATISSYSDFFCTLGRMHNLETLYLGYVLPTRPDGRREDNDTARIPTLQSLALVDDGEKCLDILKRLDVPRSCRLHLECRYPLLRGPEDEPDDAEISLRLPEFLPLLCDHFSATMDPFHTLSVFHNYNGATVGLRLWRTSSVSNSSIFYSPHDPDLFISSSPPCEHEQFPEPIEAMFDMLPLKNIRVVIIQDCQLPFYDYQWDLGFNCRDVHSIFVDNFSDANTLRQLLLTNDNTIREDDGEGKASTDHQVLLPNLHLLEVESVDFRPYMCSNGKILETGQLYVNTFRQRRMRGNAISTIRLGRDCIIDAARLDALKSVIHVEWDPNSVQEVPQAPPGLPEGLVYPAYIINPEQEE